MESSQISLISGPPIFTAGNFSVVEVQPILRHENTDKPIPPPINLKPVRRKSIKVK